MKQGFTITVDADNHVTESSSGEIQFFIQKYASNQKATLTRLALQRVGAVEIPKGTYHCEISPDGCLKILDPPAGWNPPDHMLIDCDQCGDDCHWTPRGIV